MISAELTGLYEDLSRAVNQAATFQRELATVPDTRYNKLADLHWMISDSMDRIGRIKHLIAELESPGESTITMTPIDTDVPLEAILMGEWIS